MSSRAPLGIPDRSRSAGVETLVAAAFVLVASAAAEARREAVPATQPSVPASAPVAPSGGQAILEQGIRLFDDGLFPDARATLQRARAPGSSSALVAQVELYLGLCDAAENRMDMVAQAFRRALRRDPSIDLDRRRFNPAVVNLFDRVRHQTLGVVVFKDLPPGARVTIGDREISRPERAYLVPGIHEVGVRLPDRQDPLRYPVNVVAGRESLVIVVEILRSRPAVGQAPPLEAPRRRLWTWIAGSATVVSLAVAFGLTVGALSDRSAACGLLADPALPCDARSQLQRGDDFQRYQELRDGMESKGTASNVLWIVSGALVVATGIIYYLEKRPRSPRDRSISVRAGRAGLLLSGAF